MNNIIKKLLLVLCCYGSLVAFVHAKEGKVFIHAFGELRVYYQDWLVVCEDKGQGVCRMVNIKLNSKKDTFFGNSQLTVYPALQQPRKSAMSEYNNATFISFFKRDIPPLQGAVKIAIDGKTLTKLQPNDGIFDSSSNETSKKIIAQETYWLEGNTADLILNNMPSGRWLTFSYWKNNEQVTEKFSLRGMAKSLTFIRNAVRKQ